VSGNAEPVEGKTAFLEAVNAFLGSIAGFRHEIIDVWRDGDVLVTELAVHYTRLDGGPETLPCCNVFRLRDGSVAEVPQLHRHHSRLRMTPRRRQDPEALPANASG
jgi:hypothetical protein